MRLIVNCWLVHYVIQCAEIPLCGYHMCWQISVDNFFFCNHVPPSPERRPFLVLSTDAWLQSSDTVCTWCPLYIVHPLKWRSACTSSFFSRSPRTDVHLPSFSRATSSFSRATSPACLSSASFSNISVTLGFFGTSSFSILSFRLITSIDLSMTLSTTLILSANAFLMVFVSILNVVTGETLALKSSRLRFQDIGI